MNDKDIFDFLTGFRLKDTKEVLINKYVTGDITKEEFIRRIKKLNERKI